MNKFNELVRAINGLNSRFQERDEPFNAVATLLGDGSCTIEACFIADPSIRFPVAWAVDEKAGSFQEMIAEALQVAESLETIENVLHAQALKLIVTLKKLEQENPQLVEYRDALEDFKREIAKPPKPSSGYIQ